MMHDNLETIAVGFLFGVGFSVAQWVIGALAGLLKSKANQGG